MTDVQDLLQRVRTAALSPEDAALAEAVARDLAILTADVIGGGATIESELDHLHAQAANLSATAAQNVAAEVRNFAVKVVSELIAKVLI